MEPLIVGAVAVVVGVVLGYVFSGLLGKAEKTQLAERTRELAQELAAARADLMKAQAESAARAGFESVAAERERTIVQLGSERKALREELNAKSDEASASANIAAGLTAELEAERKSLAEKLTLLETAKQTLANQFEALAADILEKKSKSFAEGSQKELGTLLDPLKTQINEFRKKVEESQSDSKTGVTKLETLIGVLAEQSRNIGDKAENLATALRGSSKAQGDWGEFILRDLLDKAGMREGEQYSFQQSFTGVEGENGDRARTVRTDVILNLPGGRHLVIDSKVSLVAYTDCASATDDEPRRAALKLHLDSVRRHVAGLAKAGYHRLPGVEAPDFVVMFVPVEPAFLLALQNDQDLWADAYKQGILLVGPTTLLYVIRIISVLWQQELQARNVREVMNRGTELYDKFVGFVGDLEAVGKSLRSADANYSNAMKKLSEGRGNLVRQVEMLRGLGVRTGKQIPSSLLDVSGVDEETFALAAESETEPARD